MFWESLTLVGQIYFIAACVASGLLVIQLVLLIIGMSADIDMDFVDGESGGIGIFTLKGIIAFFAIGGWCAFAAAVSNVHWGWSIPIFVVTGGIALVGVGLAYKGISKLQSNGVIVPEKAIGAEGEVYLTVPASGNGYGKVNLLLQERLVEVEAITKGDEPIKTGEYVTVVEIIGEKYVVERVSKGEVSAE